MTCNLSIKVTPVRNVSTTSSISEPVCTVLDQCWIKKPIWCYYYHYYYSIILPACLGRDFSSLWERVRHSWMRQSLLGLDFSRSCATFQCSKSSQCLHFEPWQRGFGVTPENWETFQHHPPLQQSLVGGRRVADLTNRPSASNAANLHHLIISNFFV